MSGARTILALFLTFSSYAYAQNIDCDIDCQKKYEKCLDDGKNTQSACLIEREKCMSNCQKK